MIDAQHGYISDGLPGYLIRSDGPAEILVSYQDDYVFVTIADDDHEDTKPSVELVFNIIGGMVVATGGTRVPSE